MTSIGERAFAYCSGLTSASIPNSLTGIREYVFYRCSGLTSVSIPDNVTSGLGAFIGCSGLTSVSIPDNVTSIGVWAFYECSGLTSVSIPNSVTSIGEDAFSGCGSLKDVTVRRATPLSIESTVFQDVSISAVTLHVPAGTKALYEAANVWKDFGMIAEDAGEGILLPPPVGVYYAQGVLTVNTPKAEQITVYSPTGALLYRAQKAAGEAVYRIDRLSGGVLIVKGESGWVKKIVK